MAFASQKLAAVISCHAWDNACLRLAICPNNHEVHLYAAPDLGQPWQRTAVLSEHDQLVSGLDWSRSDQLVSCSHDRNAYVWTCTDGHWRPEMVATRLELAALCVRWSPCGRKFAIGAAKTVCVAYRDGDKGWWVAKLMRRCHSSSVTALAWHPGGALLATASSDGRCRVFNARVAGVEGSADTGASAAVAASRFGDQLADLAPGLGWGVAVAWSPCGSEVAMACHGAALVFAGGSTSSGAERLAAAAAAPQVLRLPGRPARCLAYLRRDLVAAAGAPSEGVLLLQRGEDGAWAPLRTLHGRSEHAAAAAAPLRQVSAEFSAKLALFCVKPAPKQHGDLPGGGGGGGVGAHANAVVELRPVPGGSGLRFSTAGWDGRVVLWDAGQDAAAFADTIAALR